MFVRTMAVAMLACTPALAQQTADWSGGFVGVSAGALRSTGAASLGDYEGALLELDVSNGLFPEDIDDADVAGIGGLTFGWNRQNGTLVTGVEIDFSLTGSDVENGFAKRDPNPDPIFNGVNTITGYGTELDTLATARLKAGYASGETLFYVTGGLAAGRVKNSFSLELTELGYDYAEVPLAHHIRSKVTGAVTGKQTVPQIFINGDYIGGHEELERWARKAA